VYFFTKQELRGMLEAAPRASPRVISVAASKEEDPRDQDQDQDQGSMSEQGSMFEVNQLGEDRRLVSRVETRRDETRRPKRRATVTVGVDDPR
jgi:hypothetical protein